MRRLALVLIAVLASLLLFQPASASSHWQLVGTHPDAAAQPTAWGKELRELEPFHWGGTRIYVGYGDYGENTGPIRITPWNVGAQQWQNEGQQDTEQIDIFRNIHGILTSPSIDPAWRGDLELGSNESDYASINGNRQWPDYNKFSSVHVYDIREYGSSVIASGSDYGCNASCGTIWRSDNGGASWYQWYRSTRDASNVWGGDRCYGLSVYGSQVWASCNFGSMKFTGSSWVTDSAQRYGSEQSVHFAGNLVTPVRGNLYAFNGSERVLRQGTHKWLAVDGSYLYAVDAYNRIRRTSNLTQWEYLATMPDTARSFTVANGVLYYGDTSSRLWSMGGGSTTTTTAPTSTTSTTTASTSSTTSSTTSTTAAPTTTTTAPPPSTTTTTAPSSGGWRCLGFVCWRTG